MCGAKKVKAKATKFTANGELLSSLFNERRRREDGFTGYFVIFCFKLQSIVLAREENRNDFVVLGLAQSGPRRKKKMISLPTSKNRGILSWIFLHLPL
jgi:hypothetical protein